MKFSFPYWKILAVPLLLFFLGAASNQAVLVANHGKFPVMLNEYREALVHKHQSAADSDEEKKLTKNKRSFSVLDTQAPSDGQFIDDVHTIMGPNSRLKILADIFDMHDGIYSIGDFLIILGMFLWQYAPITWCVLVVRKFNEK
jgi:hypothetical protein